MKEVRLIRYAHKKAHTLGLIYIDGMHIMYSLELPDYENRPYVSRIPEGEYLCVRHKSNSKGWCWKVMSVPSRKDILIHVGNFKEETEGCILIGLGQTGDMITHSVNALNLLNAHMAGDTEFKLIIGNL